VFFSIQNPKEKCHKLRGVCAFEKQIICSFNTDVSKIDKALLRKGRLIAKYDFRDLSVAKANALSKKLGSQTTFSSATPLTAIYNADEKECTPIKNYHTIGFQSRNAG